MTTDLILLSTEFNSYINKAGEVVERYNLFYFNPLDLYSEKGKVVNRGYLPVVSSLDLSIFSPNEAKKQFPSLPGLYSCSQRLLSRRSYGKVSMVSSFLSCEFKEPLNFINDNESFLILGGSYKSANLDGKDIKGIKLFVLSPYLSDDPYDLNGASLLEPFIPQTNWLGFTEIPGYYSLEFKDVRGAGGSAITKIVDKNFIKPLDFGLVHV
jgi:hypothetical protein